MWDFYTGKNVFITGGSGFVGTALIYRLITQAPGAHLYVLCRGGLPSLIQKWSEVLPQHILEQMTDPRVVSVLEGDLIQPDFGLTSENMALLRQRTHIIIHSASSIALLSPLAKLVSPVIDVTERLAHFALECEGFESFVYISSAYANGHLFYQGDGMSEVVVREAIYPLNHSAIITYNKSVTKYEVQVLLPLLSLTGFLGPMHMQNILQNG
ncbi:unnamed protein product [Penicillium bialowiezense]